MKASKWNSFLFGVAKVFDLGNTLLVYQVRIPKKRRTSFHDDAQALANDWAMVGKDLRSAFRTFKTQHARKS